MFSLNAFKAIRQEGRILPQGGGPSFVALVRGEIVAQGDTLEVLKQSLEASRFNPDLVVSVNDPDGGDFILNRDNPTLNKKTRI